MSVFAYSSVIILLCIFYQCFSSFEGKNT